MKKVSMKVLSLVLSLMILAPCIGVGIVPGHAVDLDKTALDAAIAAAGKISADDYVDISALNAAVKEAEGKTYIIQTQVDDAAAEITLQLLKLEKKNTAAKVTGIAGSNIEGWSNVQLGGINATSSKAAFDANMTNSDTVHGYDGSWHWGSVFGTAFETVFKNAYAQYSIDRYTTTKLDDLGNIAFWMVAIVANGGHDHVFRLIGTEKSGGSGTEQDAVSTGSKGTEVHFRTNFNTLYSCRQGGMHGHTSPAYISTTYTPIKGDVPAAGESVQVMSYSQSNVPTNQNGLVYGHCIRFGFQFDAYDTTALRAAIAQTIYAKSNYTEASYNAYISALTEAMNVLNTPVTVKVNGDEEANYDNIAAAQTAIDNATEKLSTAIDNLEIASGLDFTEFINIINKAEAINADEYVDVSALTQAVKEAKDKSYTTQTQIDDETAKIALELLKLEKKNTAAKVIGTAGSNIEGWSNVRLCGLNATSAKSASDGNMTNADTVHSYEGNWHWGHVFGNTFETVFKNAYAQYSIDRYTTTKFDDLGNIVSWTVAVVANGGHDHVFSLIGTEKSGGSGNAQDAVSIGSKGTEVHFRTNFNELYSCKQGGMHGHTDPSYIPTTYTPIKGDVPAAGESVQVMSYSQSNVPTNQNGLFYGHCIRLGFQFDAYDTTALRAAIAQTTESKSNYTAASYNAYISALTEATNVLNTPVTVKVNGDEEANYENIAEAQTAIDNATKKLNDAYNALEDGFNIEYYIDGELCNTQHVKFTDLTSTLSDVFTKPGCILSSWKDAEGNIYGFDKIAHDFVQLDGSSVRLDAVYDEIIYTINFVDADGNNLQTSTAKYHDDVQYNGATPTKASDDDFEYTFSGWSPEIAPVEDDVIYVAQFEKKEHTYEYFSQKDGTHDMECKTCGHVVKNAPCECELEETEINEHKAYIATCKYCGYSTTALDYNITVPSDCTVKKSVKPSLASMYIMATIQAPQSKNGKYFVYWMDGNGQKVGTYRTYNFYLTDDCSFTPVYVSLEEYTEARKDAEMITRITGSKLNDDGRLSIYVEHSVSTTVGSIMGHGVVYTTNSAYNNTDSLVIGNDNVSKKLARKTANSLTGLLEVKDTFASGETVWVRPFIIDGTGAYHYGEIKAITVGETKISGEISTSSCEAFDLTEINADGDTPIDPPTDDPTEPANPIQNILEKFSAVFAKLFEIINKILEFFKSWEVVK